MFTVKATYRGETRKFTFDSNTFPTYQELYNQLYRVFPIHNSYYLSKLLFTPNSKVYGQRVLIGMLANSAEEYNKHIAPYQGQTFKDATLKFSVHDETPHKSPSTATFDTATLNEPSEAGSSVTIDRGDLNSVVTVSSAATVVAGESALDRFRRRDEGRIMLERLREKTAHRARPVSFPNSSLSSPRSSQFGSLRRVPSDPATRVPDNGAGERMFRPLPDLPTPATAGPSQSNEDDGLRPRRARTTIRPVSAFDVCPAPSPSVANLSFVVPPPPSLSYPPPIPHTPSRTHSLLVPPPPVIYPSTSATKSAAVTSPPLDADVEMESPKPNDAAPNSPPDGQGQQVSAIKAQSVDEASAAATSPVASELLNSLKQDISDVKDLVSTAITQVASLKKMVEESPKVSPSIVPPPPSLPHHYATVPRAFPSLPPFPSVSPFPIPPPPPLIIQPPPVQEPLSSLTLPPILPPPPPPRSSFFPPANPLPYLPPPNIALGTAWNSARLGTIPSQSVRPEAKKIHFGVTCNLCNKRVEGVRFKCLDCDDCDLCEACLSSPDERGKHSVLHTFWPITEPGAKDEYLAAQLQKLDGEEKVRHYGVTCDVCSTRNIEGVRFKCMDCRDYDLCSECMSTPASREKHSVAHSFFPIVRPGEKTGFYSAKLQRHLTESSDPLGRAGSQQRSQEAVHCAEPLCRSNTATHLGITCDVCLGRNITGVRFKCMQCDDFDMCGSCIKSPTARSVHNPQHAFWPIPEPGNTEAYWRARSQPPEATKVHANVWCNSCTATITGVRHKCLVCEDYDLCTDCISSPTKRVQHSLSHGFFPIDVPGDKAEYDAARTRLTTLPHIASLGLPSECPSAANLQVVHEGILCDACDRTVVGTRFKCLDCPDFDICQGCVEAGGKEAHSPFHEFFEIEKPGDTYVHTIFSGVGERPPLTSVFPPSRNNAQPATLRRPNPPLINVPVNHNATCNLCDSRIRGDRFKCLNCPDFDTCGSCFVITSDQHPGHGFIRIRSPEDLMMRDGLRTKVVHLATCNVCQERITGTRFKCMHASCPDFDLCQNCESQPIPVHPDNHPLLKMRSPTTVLPRVQRETSHEPWTTLNRPISERDLPPPWPTYSRLERPVVSPPPPSPQFLPPIQRPIPPVAPAPWVSPLDWRSWTPPPPVPLVVPTMIEESTPPYSPSSSIRIIYRNPSPSSPAAGVTFNAASFPPSPPPRRNVFSSHVIPSLESTPPLVEVSLPPVPNVSASPIPFFQHVSPVPPVDSPLVNEGRLIDIDEPAVETRSGSPVASSLPGLTTPSEVPGSNIGSTTTSVPRLGPVNNTEWRELWPELTTMLRQLLPPSVTPPAETPAAADVPMPAPEVRQQDEPEQGARETTVMEVDATFEREPATEPTEDELAKQRSEFRSVLRQHAMVPQDPLVLAIERGLSSATQEFHSAVEESPLAGEALLNRPEGSSNGTGSPKDFGTSLTEYLARMLPPVPRAPEPTLSATFVSDNNIPDGQIFPPGAEFVKSWRMLNNGNIAWPESCELVFVAGDRLAPYDDAPRQMRVGVVPPDTEVEVASGEMKAPDVPGKYVSYWRLRDGEGNYFGQSVWVDIVVAEMNRPTSPSSGEDSLAASSVIMPIPLENATTAGLPSVGRSAPASSITIPSVPLSDDGSFTSSLSLVNAPSNDSLVEVPSDEDDEDEAAFEDSRSIVLPSPPPERADDPEYVVLYDTSSEDD